MNRGGVAYSPLFRILFPICEKPRQPNFWEVIHSDFISICKFGSFKNPFAKITSLSELYFRLRRFILMVPTKKVIYVSYDSNTSSYKPWRWVRFDLKFRMKNIYINSNLNPLAKLTNSSRRTEFKDILLRNISQMITRTIPIRARIVISQAMK